MGKISYFIFVLVLGFCSEAGAYTLSTGQRPVMGIGLKSSTPVFIIDSDSDGIEEGKDNCPGVANADQKDADKNGVGDDCPVQITGNGAFFCARLDGGRVKCWGENTMGNLGLWHTQDQSIPSTLLNVNKFIQIESANAGDIGRTCGIVDNAEGHEVTCWGVNDLDSLTPKTYDDHPVEVEGIDYARDLAMGERHTCEATTNGKVFCWGSNEHGQCGQPLSKSFINTPAEVEGLTDVRKVVAGREHTCALSENDEVYCWGANSHWELGKGKDNLKDDPNPSNVSNVSGVDRLFAVDFMTCVTLKDQDTVKCWGTSTWDAYYPSATSVSFYKGVKEVLPVMPDAACSLNGDGTVNCAGTMINTTGLKDVKHIAGGWWMTLCALKKDGSVWCSGMNNHGQLGIGTVSNTPASAPVRAKF